ncbi:MAG: beta-galactosidase [Mycobacterium sp.]|jgi:beta-glucosidase/6-phospho-beta-glucosidase/beta-galactosidase|nr:beta-galactosidase [Mycobacterium sp.]
MASVSAAAYIGRVGGLAAALGIWAAAMTGGTAWAETQGSSASNESSTSSPAEDGPPSAQGQPPKSSPTDTGASTTNAPAAPSGVTAATGAASNTASRGAAKTPRIHPPSAATVFKSLTGPTPPALTPRSLPMKDKTLAVSSTAAANVSGNALAPSGAKSVAPLVSSVQQSLTVKASSAAATLQAPALTPTAPDVLRIAAGYVSTFVSAILSPFAALGHIPAAPEPPTAWTLLAWARRELLNESPVVHYNPSQNTQSLTADGDVLITGNIGASDPDDDPLTYTVVGTPHEGGTLLAIDDEGNFTYRPTRAMAAVGGTDQFTVVVSDQDAGFHLHGPMGLLQFVPIVGSFIAPGGGDAVAQTVTVTVAPVDGIDVSFPDGFHWGVATAGFQSEMGKGTPLDVNSDWYKWTHDPINQLLGLTKGVPENGPGSYNLFDTDAQLAHDEVGADTFRTGIEWSRIFPNSTASVDISDEGGTVSLADLQALDALANQDEVDHYREVFDSLRARGLEPLVTINHFTLPTWVHDPTTARLLVQLGLPTPAAGWLSDQTPVEFEKYAAYVAWKYGDQVDNWVVINEPIPPTLTGLLGIPIPGSPIPYWPPGVVRPDLTSRFLVNEANAFVAASREIHIWDDEVATPVMSPGQPAAFVGWANNMMSIRPSNPLSPLDVQAAAAFDNYWNNWFPNAIIRGEVDANLDGVITPDEIHPEMANSADFYGVNYYAPEQIIGIGVSPLPGFPPLQGIPNLPGNCATCSDTGLPVDPGGFRQVIDQAAAYGIPVWITENGIADADDSRRADYIVRHLAVVQDEIAHGTDIRGYTYWTLTDNLEWASGYEPKFGLYSYDPATLVRTARPSVAVVKQITTANLLPASLLELYLPGAGG